MRQDSGIGEEAFGEVLADCVSPVPLHGLDLLKIEGCCTPDGGHVGIAVGRPRPQFDRVVGNVQTMNTDLQVCGG